MPCLILKASNVKDKKNSGREFLRCQKDKKTKNSCDFFLWVDQARSREINYVMTNRRSEGQGPRLTQSQLPFKPLASTTSGGGGGEVGGKNRKSMRLQAKLGNIPIRSRNADGTTPAAAAAGPASSGSETSSGSDDEGGRRSSTPTRSARRVPPSDDGNGNSNDVASSLSSSHTASSRTLRSSGSQRQQQQHQQSQSDTTSQQHVGTKRKKASADNDEFSDFSDGEVRELVAIEQRSGGSAAGGTVRSRNAFITPTVSGGRSIFAAHYHDGNGNGGDGGGGGLPTPVTERSVRRVLFAPIEQKQQNKNAVATGLQTLSTSKRQRNTAQGAYTPSSSAHLRTPGTSFSSDSGAGDITADIMDMLQRGGGGGSSKVGIDPVVLDGVRGVLDQYSRRTAGFERGRDLSRREIQRQQRRIAELELRNAALENSRDLDRAALRSARRRGDAE